MYIFYFVFYPDTLVHELTQTERYFLFYLFFTHDALVHELTQTERSFERDET